MSSVSAAIAALNMLFADVHKGLSQERTMQAISDVIDTLESAIEPEVHGVRASYFHEYTGKTVSVVLAVAFDGRDFSKTDKAFSAWEAQHADWKEQQSTPRELVVELAQQEEEDGGHLVDSDGIIKPLHDPATLEEAPLSATTSDTDERKECEHRLVKRSRIVNGMQLWVCQQCDKTDIRLTPAIAAMRRCPNRGGRKLFKGY
jgi:rubrerythrin